MIRTRVIVAVAAGVAKKAREWLSAREDELDAGDVQNITAALGRLRPKDRPIRKEVKTEMEYFRRNAKRMRYTEFRSRGLFVGSGVVEAQ
jgi:hypothetical protein